MTVSASLDPTIVPDTWQWYLDGEAVTEATGSSVTIGSSLSEGFHRIAVIIHFGSISSSHSAWFQVGTTVVTVLWEDDFESYSIDTAPFENWSFTGNTDGYIDNSTSVSGSNSFRLHGTPGACAETLAIRNTNFSVTPLYVEFNTQTGYHEGGCHGWTVSFDFRDTNSWSTWEGRAILGFAHDINTITTAGDVAERSELATYAENVWYKVKIKYVKNDNDTVTLNYWDR